MQCSLIYSVSVQILKLERDFLLLMLPFIAHREKFLLLSYDENFKKKVYPANICRHFTNCLSFFLFMNFKKHKVFLSEARKERVKRLKKNFKKKVRILSLRHENVGEI